MLNYNIYQWFNYDQWIKCYTAIIHPSNYDPVFVEVLTTFKGKYWKRVRNSEYTIAVYYDNIYKECFENNAFVVILTPGRLAYNLYCFVKMYLYNPNHVEYKMTNQVLQLRVTWMQISITWALKSDWNETCNVFEELNPEIPSVKFKSY